MRKKILFIAPYPSNQVASQRFRFEQYLSMLKTKHVFDMHSFYSIRTFSILYKKGHFTEKLIGFLSGYVKTLWKVTRIVNYDLVFIHREATPLGPPIIEWIIARVFNKPIIYDLDDAIWLPDDQSKEHYFWTRLKFRQKIGSICRWSYKVSCGNSFLADYAKQHNPRVSIIPTTIDTQNYHIPAHPDHTPLIIGWTGSHSTLPYLEEVIPILTNLKNRFDFVLKVICNKQPGFEFPGMVYINWSKQKEIAELNAMDIGIMPLPDTDWSKGKCGFKILQYMALEKPAVASAVGVNTEIIQHGQNGLLCHRQSDWSNNLELLLTDQGLRNKLGKNGRVTVEHHYSKSAIATSFMSLFD